MAFQSPLMVRTRHLAPLVPVLVMTDLLYRLEPLISDFRLFALRAERFCKTLERPTEVNSPC